jgi:hypothetical protein
MSPKGQQAGEGSENHSQTSSNVEKDLGQKSQKLDVATEHLKIATGLDQLLRLVAYQRAATQSLEKSFEATEKKIECWMYKEGEGCCIEGAAQSDYMHNRAE